MIPFALIASLGHSPLPAVIFGGIFVGAALSTATRRTRHRKDPEGAAARKWILSCLWLSLAVVFGLLAVFVPGPAHILDPRLGWVAGIAAAASFLALRFRKAAGLPVIGLLAALVVVTALFLQSVRALTGETEIASLRAIGVDSASMRLELVPRGGQPALLTMNGVEFAPVVKVVIFDDLLVFLGARTCYRFVGMTSFDANGRQANSDYMLPAPPGISEKVWEFCQKYNSKIPGVKAVQTERPSVRAQEFASYRIMVENDGGVQVVQRP